MEPIAIVGPGCVLPDAKTPHQYWDNLLAGKVSLSDIPSNRWNHDLYHARVML
jgi:acyl transferase domain-containing protein